MVVSVESTARPVRRTRVKIEINTREHSAVGGFIPWQRRRGRDLYLGILAQYAGRLHRQGEGKTEVIVYDHADLAVPGFMAATLWSSKTRTQLPSVLCSTCPDVKPTGKYQDRSQVPVSR
jgi:hypothetical protein